jgi:hypothetical protein
MQDARPDHPHPLLLGSGRLIPPVGNTSKAAVFGVPTTAVSAPGTAAHPGTVT